MGRARTGVFNTDKLVTMYYYGTDLREAGHYFWHITERGLERHSEAFRQLLNHSFPFDVYKHAKEQKGTTLYRYENGYSIVSITGSCSDQRGGTVSVFFKQGEFSMKEMLEEMRTYEVVKKMIAKMPFSIQPEVWLA